jgi:Ni,Fe-hydrogenase III large subunit
MRKEIEEIRQALLAIDALDDEANEALATLEEAIEEIDHHPESGQVREVVHSTAGTLGTADAEAHRGIAGKWLALKENIAHWEEEHPSVVLAVGRISDSLAAVGL